MGSSSSEIRRDEVPAHGFADVSDPHRADSVSETELAERQPCLVSCSGWSSSQGIGCVKCASLSSSNRSLAGVQGEIRYCGLLTSLGHAESMQLLDLPG